MTTTKHFPAPNGIRWMLTDSESLIQAAQRMEQQCPVTAKTLCINAPEPEVDPVRSAWDEEHRDEQAAGRAELMPVAKELSSQPQPVPSFSDLVRQQETYTVG